MAKAEFRLNGNLEEIAESIHTGMVENKVLTALQEETITSDGELKILFRVYERFYGKDTGRISLSVVMVQNGDGPVHISAIPSGGEDRIFRFWNETYGEKDLLARFTALCEDFQTKQNI